MSSDARAAGRRAWLVALAVSGVLAYVPALTAAPGRMPSDSKLYLYLSPGRFLADAAGSFDPRQFAGWVPHQHISYLWPAGPWFWAFEAVGVPDWVAHRVWIGTILVAAGLGAWWCARQLGLGATAAVVAAVVYQTSLYVLPYVSRTSVMLLPWAGLGWIVAFTVRATRRRTWGDPAAIALVVLTVGSVNATALAMIVPAPVLWLVHAVAQRRVTPGQAVLVAARTGLLALGVSLWWIVMLIVQARHGIDVLPYSEALADVSRTATSSEVWRALGYWLFYIRDPAAATTTESLRYLASTPAIVVSFLVPIVGLSGLVWVRWAHRRFAMLLTAVGVLLAVGVHPIDDRSPLMRILAGDDDAGLALALRSSTRALPVAALGLALGSGALVAAFDGVRLPALDRARVAPRGVVAVAVAALAVVNLPALWTGAFVDPALERDAEPPPAWIDAAAALDATGSTHRVLQLPGAEFGAFRWGYTVDQPLPGLTERPLVTRDLLPLGSPAAMDLLYALDDRVQSGTLEGESVAPVARLLGVDTIWLANDLAVDRFRTARPEVVRAVLATAPDIGAPLSFGDPIVNVPTVPMTDERAVGDPRVGEPVPRVELFPIDDPVGVVRASAGSVLIAGSGDGVVDAAAAGLIDGRTTVRYAASDRSVLPDAPSALIVTDTNRAEARHWRSSQDTRGFTEPASGIGVLREVASDARLPVFDDPDPDRRTVAEQEGAVTASATSYGEPFAYLPEHRPFMAIDGDLDTAWSTGDHGDPIGEVFRLALPPATGSVSLVQPAANGARGITEIVVSERDDAGAPTRASRRVALDERSTSPAGQPIGLAPATTSVDIEIAAVGGHRAGTPGAAAGVGFAEILHPHPTTVEVVRPPRAALAGLDPDLPLAFVLTRLRHDPMDRWRDDPEPTMRRRLELPQARRFRPSLDIRIDARATDAELAEMLGWPAVASSRLTGSVRAAGVAALDGADDTSWITAFGEATGASITIVGVTEQIDRIEIRQPVAGFSRVHEVTVRSGDESRAIRLVPDAGGAATSPIDPPLPAGDLTVELTGVDVATTIDRRFADVVELPAAISEIVVPGRPEPGPLAAVAVETDCTTVALVDGEPLRARLTTEGSGWLDGGRLSADPCVAELEIGDGTHEIRTDGLELPVQVDRIVLDDGVAAVAARAATADVVERARFARTITVGACPDGCWVVLGEGFNEAWSAALDGVDLGPPDLVDGGFNGWWLEPSPEPRSLTFRWTAQRPVTIALALSALAAAFAIVLVVVDVVRGRRGDRAVGERPARVELTGGGRRLSRRAATTAAIGWVVLGVLVGGPIWGMVALLPAAITFRWRSPRLAELVTLCSVAAIGAAVVVVERRDAPLPDGGWPTEFEFLHGAGMLAVVGLVIGAIVATDARDEVPAADDPASLPSGE